MLKYISEQTRARLQPFHASSHQQEETGAIQKQHNTSQIDKCTSMSGNNNKQTNNKQTNNKQFCELLTKVDIHDIVLYKYTYKSRASLSRASLSRASLSRASLSRASLSRPSLSRPSLSRASLSRPSLSRPSLSRASFMCVMINAILVFSSIQSQTNINDTVKYCKFRYPMLRDGRHIYLSILAKTLGI